MVSRNRVKTGAAIAGLIAAAGFAGAAAGDASAHDGTIAISCEGAVIDWDRFAPGQNTVGFSIYDDGNLTIEGTHTFNGSNPPPFTVGAQARTRGSEQIVREVVTSWGPGADPPTSTSDDHTGSFGDVAVITCPADEPPTVGIPPIPVPPVHGDPVPPTGGTPIASPPVVKPPPLQITPPRFMGAACKRLRWGTRQTLRLRFKTRPGRPQRVRVVVKVPRGLVLTTTAKRQGWKQRGGTLVRIFPKLKHRKKARELRVRVVGIVPGRWIVRARVNGKLSNPYCRVVRRSPKPKLPPVTG